MVIGHARTASADSMDPANGAACKGDASAALTHLRVAVVTPVPLQNDYRSLKQALTLERAGILAGVLSGGKRVKTAEALRALDQPAAAAPGAKTAGARRGILRRIWQRVRSQPGSWLLQAPVFAAWLAIYSVRWILRPLIRLPAADIYILHEFSQFPAVWAHARRNRACIVYDAHDFYTGIEEGDQVSQFDRRWLLPFSRLVERACIARSASVWTVSEGLVDLLRTTYGVEAEVLRNTHDPRLDASTIGSTVPLRTRLGLSDDAFVVVNVGNCKKGHAIDEALTAIAGLPDIVHLVFVGAGYEVHREKIAATGLSGRVHLLGRLNAVQIVPTIRAADAALVAYVPRSANYRACLPNGFFQGVAAGLPVIAPDLPEIRTIVERFGIGHVVDMRMPAAIGAAIASLIEDRAALSNYQAQIAAALDELSWVREERKMLASLAKLAGRAGGDAPIKHLSRARTTGCTKS